MRKTEIPDQYPTVDPEGFVTTFGIVKKLKIDRERLRKWIEGGYVKPLYQVPDPRGTRSYFAKAQMIYIRLFQQLVDMGTPRELAKLWVQAFDNLRCRKKEEPDWVIFPRKDKRPTSVTLVYGSLASVKLEEDIDDAYVVNFRKIFKEINALK
jgi:hypothetical protein